MNYYNEIKDKLIKNEISRKVRDYYANKSDLNTYYEVGKLLSEAGKHYGEGIIKEYSIKLENDIGKKYSERMLRNMRSFYNRFQKQKWNPLVSKLSWSHIIILLRLKNIDEINYYVTECINHNYSKRELERIIKNKEYQRIDDKAKSKIVNNEKLDVVDYIKDSIILNKKHDYNKISEYALKEIIMNDLDNFLNQLGDGFSYIGNEYKIKIGNTYNYIDILLFNIIYNCYVVVELKINKLTKQDIGQIMVYMNYVNDNIKLINQDKTIGIIVCKENDKYLIRYSSDSRIHVVNYEIV